MKTKILNEEPYGELLCSHLNKEFPHAAKLSKFETVDAVANLIVGTKEIRYGSLPVPEHNVVIREAIRNAIDNNQPVKILVPWGSIKADFSATLDIAEVSAIQRLVHLNDAIKDYYPLGIEFVIRIEDTSGYTLFALEGDQDMIRRNIDSYSADMKTLVKILDKDNSIRVELESSMLNAVNFNAVFFSHLPYMEQYLVDSWEIVQSAHPEAAVYLDSFSNLMEMGWKGIISWEQRNHYVEAYKRIYPDWSLESYIKRLALYFTGAWTRHKLEMTGKGNWFRFIQLAFIPPIKGLPEGYNYNYVYYRTLPLSEARTHIPPWRAKGYLKINGNDIHHKLTTFNDADTLSLLTSVKMELSDENGLKVIVNADYLLES